MKLQAKARLSSLISILASVVNTTDRPPSTYMDEAEADHQLPREDEVDDELIGKGMDDADNPGNTGYQPDDKNQNLIKQSDAEIMHSDTGPTSMGMGLGAGHRLLSTGPLQAMPDLGDYQTL